MQSVGLNGARRRCSAQRLASVASTQQIRARLELTLTSNKLVWVFSRSSRSHSSASGWTLRWSNLLSQEPHWAEGLVLQDFSMLALSDSLKGPLDHRQPALVCQLTALGAALLWRGLSKSGGVAWHYGTWGV